ncbi:hypothetical protein ACFW1M_35985 [Streptomyces inhibens]
MSFLAGAVVAILLLIVQRRSRMSTLAFGPSLIIGTLAATLTTNT